MVEKNISIFESQDTCQLANDGRVLEKSLETGRYGLIDELAYNKSIFQFNDLNEHLKGLSALLSKYEIEITKENLIGTLVGGEAYFREMLNKQAESQLNEMNIPSKLLRERFKAILLDSIPPRFYEELDDFLKGYWVCLSDALAIQTRLSTNGNVPESLLIANLEVKGKGQNKYVCVSEKFLEESRKYYYREISKEEEALISDMKSFIDKHISDYIAGYNLPEVIKWYCYNFINKEEASHNLCKLTTLVTFHKKASS